MLLRRFRRKKAVSDPVTVVSRFVDAANRHDADAIARCLHPDFESIQPIYPSRNFRGSAQVKRNWQAIFESEPGFRLSLVRSAANENTVWVELHGAGRDVEVAGVFIMGVENEQVRWARVYSAVVEQPAPKMAVHEDEPAAAEDSASVQEEAEALRRLLDAGRPTDPPLTEVAEDDAAAAEEDAEDGEAEVVLIEAVADATDDDEDDDEYDDDDEDDADDDAEYDEYDDDDDDEDDDEADDEDEDEEAVVDEADEVEVVEIAVGEAVVGEAVVGEAVVGEAVVDEAVAAPDDADADGDATGEFDVTVLTVTGLGDDDVVPPAAEAPNPYADPDSFWSGNETHDLVGGDKRQWRPAREEADNGGLGGDEDALVVDFSAHRSDSGDDRDSDDPTHRSGRRRGGRRRR